MFMKILKVNIFYADLKTAIEARIVSTELPLRFINLGVRASNGKYGFSSTRQNKGHLFLLIERVDSLRQISSCSLLVSRGQITWKNVFHFFSYRYNIHVYFIFNK